MIQLPRTKLAWALTLLYLFSWGFLGWIDYQRHRKLDQLDAQLQAKDETLSHALKEAQEREANLEQQLAELQKANEQSRNAQRVLTEKYVVLLQNISSLDSDDRSGHGRRDRNKTKNKLPADFVVTQSPPVDAPAAQAQVQPQPQAQAQAQAQDSADEPVTCKTTGEMPLVTRQQPPVLLCLRKTSPVYRTVKSVGRWPPCEFLARYLSQPNSTVIFVGVATGVCALDLASKNHTVMAFEAEPETHRMVSESILLNSRSGFTVAFQEQALGKITGKATLTVEKQSRISIIQAATNKRPFGNGQTEKVQVNVTSLDTEISIDHPPISLISIDCLGCAVDALKGAEEVLQTVHVDVLHIRFSPTHLAQAGSSGMELLSLLHAHGYAIVRAGSKGAQKVASATPSDAVLFGRSNNWERLCPKDFPRISLIAQTQQKVDEYLSCVSAGAPEDIAKRIFGAPIPPCKDVPPAA
eukprot:m.109292 g.109292  ORF g.109292 m.109292 type:complete len:468 (+) comp15886_c0_seq4:288-1691(+)